MPKRRTHAPSTDEPQPAPPERRYYVDHYGKSRNFAAYERQTLIAVTLYRKGAEEITVRLEDKDRRIAALEHQLAAVSQQTPAPPSPPSAEPVAAQAWRPPQQLPLITEDWTPYRITSPRRRPAHALRRS